MNGPTDKGKYDDECEEAFKKCQALGCLLIVVEGKFGSGFSAVIDASINRDIPQILRKVADGIEEQHKQMEQN